MVTESDQHVQAPATPRRRRRWLRWLAVLVVLLCALTLGADYVLDFTYLQRALNYPENPVTNVDWFVPKEKVPGGPIAEIPLASSAEIAIAPSALDAAAADMEKRRSSSLLILHQDKIVFEGYWLGTNADSWNTSKSMAKTLVALLVGIALDEGKIKSIDDPACNYLPAWSGDPRKTITLRHLLQMSSGLRDMGEYEELYTDASYLALGSDMQWIVDHVTLANDPGKVFNYNNVNTQALAMVLEKATGRRYAQYLSEKLWKPLGNADAAMWLDHEGGGARAFGYVFATPRDWARVGLMLLHAGRFNGKQIVPEPWIRQMLQPAPTEPDYGLQIWLANNGQRQEDLYEPLLVKDLFWLDGKSKQRVYIVPSKDLVIVRTGQQTRKWDEAFLVNTVIRGMSQ